MAEWLIEPLDKRRVCQKRRRTIPGEPKSLCLLPAEWRELLIRWVQRGGISRWDTLLKDSGATGRQRADDLLGWLLRSGWAAVTEQWELGAWWPRQVELLHVPQLRTALGLRNKDADAQRWQELRPLLQALDDTALTPAVSALDELPPQRALSRAGLLLKLQDWKIQQRCGTLRDFSLFARNDTKAVKDAEWEWLSSLLDLAEFGIERHTPLLLIAAPLRLQLSQGQLDLSACPDFTALTPATINAVQAIFGTVKHWHLIENRTSFDRSAKVREADVGVVWLPGYPPGWWHEAMGRMLELAPAPALLSCDPDPAGIAIALKAAEPWRTRNLAWQPWKMAADYLAALPARKPLNETDRKQLAVQQANSALPPILAELAEWMLAHAEKGEQEGYL